MGKTISIQKLEQRTLERVTEEARQRGIDVSHLILQTIEEKFGENGQAGPVQAGSSSRLKLDYRTSRRVMLLILTGTILLALYGLIFVVIQTIWPGDPSSNWLLSILRQQYAATIGVPLCAVAAICIVLLLETTAGPIEIESPWVKFKGATVPVIIWILTFLALTFALGHLWIRPPSI